MVNIQRGTFSGGHSTSAGGHGPKMPPLGYGPGQDYNQARCEAKRAIFKAKNDERKRFCEDL